jgi:hypothetical protein
VVVALWEFGVVGGRWSGPDPEFTREVSIGTPIDFPTGTFSGTSEGVLGVSLEARAGSSLLTGLKVR